MLALVASRTDRVRSVHRIVCISKLSLTRITSAGLHGSNLSTVRFILNTLWFKNVNRALDIHLGCSIRLDRSSPINRLLQYSYRSAVHNVHNLAVTPLERCSVASTEL